MEENLNLSGIHLAVKSSFQNQSLSTTPIMDRQLLGQKLVK